MTTHAEHPPAIAPHPHDERHRRGWFIVVGIAALVIVALTVLTLAIVRHRRSTKTRADRSAVVAKGPRVMVAKVALTKSDREVTFPAEIRPFAQATLYAKLAGYVRDIRVERGQRVKEGDLLAVLEAPENAQDVAAARSDYEIKRLNADRYAALASEGVASRMDRDNAVSLARIAQATLERARSVLDYTNLRAPFDGVVTARYVDPGALLPAATTTTSAAPLLDLADIDRLRIFVYPGQDVAPFVHPGDAVTLWQDEMAAKQIAAKVTFTAGSLDQRTRTMQTEIDIDNRPWGLLPGTFIHARLRVAVPPSPAVPNDAITLRDGKVQVAVIDGGKVHFAQIEIGSNDGKTTRVLRGLVGGETVGLNMPVEIAEGEAVQTSEPPPQAAPPGAEAAPKPHDLPTTNDHGVDAGP